MPRLIDLQEIKGKTILLTQEEDDQCRNFANNSKYDHLFHGRNIKQIFWNIYIGKKGEVGFYKLTKEIFRKISGIKFAIKEYGDGGNDFILKEHLRTDVKSFDEDYKNKVYFNFKYPNFEIISLVKVNKEKITYIGSITKGMALENVKIQEKNGEKLYYVNRSLFEKSKF